MVENGNESRVQGWSAKRKSEVVLRLLPGKELAKIIPGGRSALADNARSRAEAAHSVPVIQRLTPSQVADLLARAKVLVFPSVVEGFALLALEAAAAGTPVIAYQHQPVREYMPEFYLHDIGDCEGMVTTAEKFLSADTDDRLHKHRTTALEAAQDYSPARQRDSLLEVWDRIIGNHG